MQPTLPVSRLIDVNVALTPAGAQSQDLSTLLLLTTNTAVLGPDRFAIYESYAAVLLDFGAGKVATAAQAWFSQNPKPKRLIVGTWPVAENATQVIGYFDLNLGQQWYAVACAEDISTANALLMGQAVEALTNKHIFGVVTGEDAALVAATTTDMASVLKGANLKRTLVCYAPQILLDPIVNHNEAVVAALAKLLTVDYNQSNSTLTLMYKVLAGQTGANLNSTQVASLEGKNCNVFTAYDNDTTIFQRGVMADGTFADVVTGTDWLAVTIQTACFNVLYTTPTKVPQTDAGMHLLTTAAESVCSQGVVNGLLAPGQWNSDGFGALANGDYMAKGFYVYAQPVAKQLQADRAARLAAPLQIAAKLAGAVHEVQININVNP